MTEKLRKCREELLAAIRRVREDTMYPPITQNKKDHPDHLRQKHSSISSHSENKRDSSPCPPIQHLATESLKLMHGKGILTEAHCNNPQCKMWPMYNHEDLLYHGSNATATRKSRGRELKEGEYLHKNICMPDISGNHLNIFAKTEPFLEAGGEPRTVTTKEDDDIIEMILDLEEDYNHKQFWKSNMS